MVGFHGPSGQPNVFNPFNFFGRKDKGVHPSVVIGAFAAGLEAGISMVRIAASKEDQRSLAEIADIMEQALIEFVDAQRKGDGIVEEE